ncbi:MAG: chromate resistance protein ChrB domain-containing protein [Planktotalea sp.]|uniref:chromate resistance protein ChrB domain-containing protein n=1 Tax=Planktotalea sp. TaxID=2029877 RepID=UPI003C76163F
MTAPNTITAAQLMRLIGTPDVPVLIDICIDEDFADDPRLIPTSFRHSFKRIEDLAPDLQKSKTVVICQKGKKLSQGAAALLRTHGVDAEVLEGGILGWRDHGGSLVPAKAIPERGALWVTRHRPKIDRIACPWLIRRFIDPDARILFVAPSEVAAVAEKFGAIPFDVNGSKLSHGEGTCSFDAFLAGFDLATPALKAMSDIIRAADGTPDAQAPEAAGLLAISLGLSRMYRDNLAQLEAALPLYDALYRWARDAKDETHDWDAHGGAA